MFDVLIPTFTFVLNLRNFLLGQSRCWENVINVLIVMTLLRNLSTVAVAIKLDFHSRRQIDRKNLFAHSRGKVFYVNFAFVCFTSTQINWQFYVFIRHKKISIFTLNRPEPPEQSIYDFLRIPGKKCKSVKVSRARNMQGLTRASYFITQIICINKPKNWLNSFSCNAARWWWMLQQIFLWFKANLWPKSGFPA